MEGNPNFLKKNKDHVVVFYRVDRIGRNLSVFHGIEKMMDAGRVYVVEHGDEPVDNDSGYYDDHGKTGV